MLKTTIIFLIVAIHLNYACIPLGLESSCNCQQNPSCGQCLAPIPPVQCQSCAFSNDVQPSFAPYAAPQPEPPIPTANNNYPQILPSPQQFSQQPIAIPIAQSPEYPSNPPSQNPLEPINNNNYISEKDQELRNAIAEYNEKEGMSFPFPGESSTQLPIKKPNVVSPPAAEPPVDDYSGLPAIYFTTKPGSISIIKNKQKPTTTEQPNPYNNEELEPTQKANVSIPDPTTAGYESTESISIETTSTTLAPSTRAYAFASGTYWAVLEERETENGDIKQRRIPYHSYQQEVCTGATLGRSIEKDLESVALKCTMIGCAAVNVRPVFENSDQYEAIYLRNVNARRKTKAYTCISIIDVPVYDQVYQKREQQKEFDPQTNRRRMAVNQPARLRFVSIEPKGIY